MNLQELEQIVANVLEKPELGVGVQQYRKLLYLLNERHVNVSEDPEFQSIYNDFYSVNRRSADFYPAYFNVFQKALDNPNISPRQIFDCVCEASGKNEIVYTSKILHNLDQNTPIFDSVVGTKHFGFERSVNKDLEIRKNETWDMYFEYKRQFLEYLKKTDDAKLIVNMFDVVFPEYKALFTAVKKLDFVLWQDRTIIDKKTKNFIQIQRIEIPDQYKCHQ